MRNLLFVLPGTTKYLLGPMLDATWYLVTRNTVCVDVIEWQPMPSCWHLMYLTQAQPALFPSWLCRSWLILLQQSQSYVWSSYLLRWVKSPPLMRRNLILIYILLQFRRNIQKILYKTPCFNQEEKHACNPRTRSCLNMGLSAEKNTNHTLQVSYYLLQHFLPNFWLGSP